MNITAGMVKELRETTGAGMLDCKKALQECNGNMTEAVDYLREKGISKAAKKAQRIAAEGLSKVFIKDNKAVIVEFNSETDFVAKNEQFISLIDESGKALLESSVNTLEEALTIKIGDKTIDESVINATATIGEKISFRRFEIIEKNDEEVFGSYLHMGGKISAVVIIKGDNEAVAKDVAMQAAAMKPKYAFTEEVPAEEIEHERTVLKEQAMNEGKPAEIAEKMVEGRINKFFKEIVLNEQQFVKDSDLTIKSYLKNNNSELVKMVRYEVGEGIEKREENFADEVMGQING